MFSFHVKLVQTGRQADRRTDKMTDNGKTIRPQIFRYRGIKTVGQEEIAHNQEFLLFPQFFQLDQKIVSPFVNISDIISLFAAELKETKLVCEVKG